MMPRASTVILSLGLAISFHTGFGQTPRTGQQRVSWRVRTLVGDQRLMQWRTGPSAAAYSKLTFTEAVDKTDSLGLNSIEGSSAQTVSPEISKKLDYKLSDAEREAIRKALTSANVKMIAYRAGAFSAAEPEQRKVLEFAKAMGADTVIGSADAATLAGLDKLAGELALNIALENATPETIDRLSNRIGLTADALSKPKGRLFVVSLDSTANLTPFFTELNRQSIRPLFLALNRAELKDVEAFEHSIQPALGAFVVAASKNMPVRGPQTLPADVVAKIDAAIPRQPYAKPKKPRKLLVIDACVANMSHNTIPHFNLAIELMSKYTGAFEPVFSNDLDNLRWPKIKEFDAIYLNDTVGELFPELEIRQNLLRYVREGGGIGGWHGSGWASRSWRELGDMMGGMDAPHRIERAYLTLDDPKSPLNQSFDGTGIEHVEEYYRFNYEGPTGGFYSRDKLHVLLSLDTAKSPEIFKPGRDGKPFFQRPDNDYAVAWIRSYGKGRVYYNSMGHMAQTMMSKQIMGHVFAAIQFLVGDLAADTTPSAKLANKK